MDRQLPTELWYRVIEVLPTKDQKTCLSISKMHHDIAVKHVFSHVIITLGLWGREDEMESWWEDNVASTVAQVIEERRVARRNYALLRHIMRTPAFAHHVKKLTVRAYSFSKGNHMVYELGTLVDAIEALEDLTAFAWYGPLPIIPCEVMDALRRSSGEKVVDILLHPEIWEGVCLSSFPRLKSLVFTYRFVDPWTSVYSGDSQYLIPYCKTVCKAIAANSATLRRLDVFGDVLWQCPPSSFSNLHELTIVFPYTLDGLGSVFEHCDALASFTLCVENKSIQLASVVKAFPEAFPNITSFKLLSVFNLPQEVVEDVSKFLRKKKLLRRVDVFTRTEVNSSQALSNLPILKILPELPLLEVLGLDIRQAKLTAAHIKLLRKYVPSQVTALFLLFHSGSCDAKVADWRKFFSKHPALHYLHIVTRGRMTRKLGNAIFKQPPPALELLGYNNGLRWVSHNPTAYSEFWPHAKLYFRNVEDFCGHEDWEWLLRHHGQDDDDCNIWLKGPPDAWKRMDVEMV